MLPSNARRTLDKQQLKETATLIRRFGRSLVLNRLPGFVDDGAGGLRRPAAADTALPAQYVYFGGKLNNRMNNLPFETETAIGEFVKSTHVLVGMPMDKWELKAFDVMEDDYFILNGKKYSVTFIHDDRTYQVKAECKYMGT